MKFLTNIDLSRNEIQNARIQNLATAPSDPVPGQIYYNTADKLFYGWTGTGWIGLGHQITGEQIVTLINATTARINDRNLSANANDAINKRHSHTNQSILDDIEAPYTIQEKNKLAGIEEGANRYVHPSTHPASMITGLSTVATSGDYNDLSNRPSLGSAASRNVGSSSGNVPVIGSDGKLDASILPAIAITDTFVVSSESAMLELDVQIGDICVRTDLSKSFILKQEPASTLSNWQELLAPADSVLSVNGKTGVVILTKNDIGLSNVDNIKQASKTDFDNHNDDHIRHISALERVYWNSKTGKYAEDIGDGTATTFIIEHNLNTIDVTVGLREKSSGNFVICDIVSVDENSIKLLFSQPPSTNQYRVTVTG